MARSHAGFDCGRLAHLEVIRMAVWRSAYRVWVRDREVLVLCRERTGAEQLWERNDLLRRFAFDTALGLTVPDSARVYARFRDTPNYERRRLGAGRLVLIPANCECDSS